MAYYLFKKFKECKAGDSKLCHHQLASQSSPFAIESIDVPKNETIQDPVEVGLPQTAEGRRIKPKCATCAKEKHDTRVYRWKIIPGLLLPFMLASLDLTIISTALPFIASHFGKLPPQYSLRP
jgi:hypothetical protein